MKPHGDEWWLAQEDDSEYQRKMREEAEQAAAEDKELAFFQAMQKITELRMLKNEKDS